MVHDVIMTDGPPWGFRIAGGADHYSPIKITRVTPGTKSAKAGLKLGDVVSAINGIQLHDLTRREVEDMIINAKERIRLSISKNEPIQEMHARASDPTWVELAQEMSKPRQLGELAAEGGLVTHGKKFADKHPVSVSNSTPDVWAVRRAMAKDAGKHLCSECGLPLGKEYTSVGDLNYHKTCFCCAAPNCQGDLSRGYIVERGKAYCTDCHDKYLAKPCARCGQSITGQVYHALNNQWHLKCFKCSVCEQPFLDGVFYFEEGKLYCENDYKRYFTATCDGCKQVIEAGERQVSVGGNKWHDKCFQCSRCKGSLHGKMFVKRNNLPTCHACA